MLIERVTYFDFLQKYSRKTNIDHQNAFATALRLFSQFSVIQLITGKLTFLSLFNISGLHFTLSKGEHYN